MKRSRPKQHRRKLKSGRVITINRGRKKRIKRYSVVHQFSPEEYNEHLKSVGVSPEDRISIISRKFKKPKRNYGSSMFRGIDDMELILLDLQGKIQPRGDRKAIFLTPSKKIAKKYNKNVLEIDTTDLDIQKVPGRSRMFLTKKEIWPGQIKNIEKNYGFFGKKKKQEDKYLNLTDKEYLNESIINSPDYNKTYGKINQVSGKSLGGAVAASGIIVPIILPAPLTIAAGKVISDKVDNVKLIRTDKHDKKYKIPRIQFQRRY